MKLDRTYQKNLLLFLLESYPLYEDAKEHCDLLKEEDQTKYIANVVYLQDHGLLENGVEIVFSSDAHAIINDYGFPAITEKGIDFVLQDGGLSAILNVQTVKLHSDTIKELI